MPSGRLLLVSVAGACIASTAIVGAPSAHAGILLDRWASPTGTDADSCVQADPCDIVKAINQAAANSTVHITPGTYGTVASPLTTELDTNVPVTIVGTAPKHPPVIISASPDDALAVHQSTVANLVIVSSAASSGLDLLTHSTANRVAVYASKGGYGACTVYDSNLVNSLCATTADNTAAIDMSIGGGVGTTSTDNFVGVTAVASGRHSAGLSASAGNGLVFSLSVTNCIIHGKQYDVRANGYSGSTTSITLKHSAYRPSLDTADGASTISGDTTDVHAMPKFVDAAKADYREARTSPTIDAGRSTSSRTDLAGKPRTLGRSPDIGAYEFLPRPRIAHFTLTGVRHRKATFTMTVNPEGLDTHVRLLARDNKGKAQSPAVDVGHGRRGTHLTLSIRLDRLTNHHVRARAVNRAGATQSGNLALTTK